MWRISERWWAAATALAFLLLGVTWAFASPQGSTDDEEFHLASVWCAWGEWSGCSMQTTEVRPNGKVRELNPPIATVPDYIANIHCYVYEDRSAACIHDLSAEPVRTTRLNYQHNPPLYYSIMRVFASDNPAASVQVMRLANVTLASGLFLWALILAPWRVARGLRLAWGVAAIPLFAFYVTSTNPTAWSLAGLGVFWAFCLTATAGQLSRRRRTWAVVGAVVSAAVAVAARYDSVVWIAVSLLMVAILRLPVPRNRRNLGIAAAAAGAIVVVGALAVAVNFDRLVRGAFSIPSTNTATDQPNPIVKVILEIPAYLGAMFGAQQPQWVIAENSHRQDVAGYVQTGLAGTLGDGQFASAVGYFLAGAAIAVLIVAVGHYRRRTAVAMTALVVALPVMIVAVRALLDFGPQVIQPRYFLPWLVLTLGVGLTVGTRGRGLVSRGQAVVVGSMITVGGSLAWLVLASRYAIGQDAAFTNFGQAVRWWWPVGPSRLVWFAIAIGVTAIWAATTLAPATRTHGRIVDTAQADARR